MAAITEKEFEVLKRLDIEEILFRYFGILNDHETRLNKLENKV